jgi:hypothetical protein
MMQSELKYFIGASGDGTAKLELRARSNPVEEPLEYVPAG